MFLRTNAADVIQNLFCNCKVCRDAREYPEKPRLRSMLLDAKEVNIRIRLNAKSFLRMLDVLLENEIILRDTCVYASHINHKHDFAHEEYQRWFDENSTIPVVAAYDGMKLS